MYKDFSELNEANKKLAVSSQFQVCQRFLNAIQNRESSAMDLPSVWARAYAGVQSVQYNEDGKIEDVTSANAISTVDSELVKARNNFSVAKDQCDSLNQQFGEAFNMHYSDLFLSQMGILDLDNVQTGDNVILFRCILGKSAASAHVLRCTVTLNSQKMIIAFIQWYDTSEEIPVFPLELYNALSVANTAYDAVATNRVVTFLVSSNGKIGLLSIHVGRDDNNDSYNFKVTMSGRTDYVWNHSDTVATSGAYTEIINLPDMTLDTHKTGWARNITNPEIMDNPDLYTVLGLDNGQDTLDAIDNLLDHQ